MSIYRIAKISILLGTGILVACSSNETETAENSSIVKESSSVEKKAEFHGSRVYIDPETGQYINKPPKNSNSGITTNNSVTEKADSTVKYSAPKESNVPGVGVHMDLDESQLNGK